MMAVMQRPPKMPIFHFRFRWKLKVKIRRVMYCTREPKKKATATERKMAIMTVRALSVLMKSAIGVLESSAIILTAARVKEAPRSSKTRLTVVDVGSPSELKMSRRMMSATMTARKMLISSAKVKCSGWKMPCRVRSIMPLLKQEPRKMPMAATIRTVL